MSAEVLTLRQLNRATLARQLLLERSEMPVLEAVGHLVGLQGQNPFDPYLALWSRLDGFDPHELGRALEERAAVRIVVMRGTVHLTTAGDALALRPVTQPVVDAEIRRHPEFAPLLVDVDLRPILTWSRRALATTPMSGRQLAAAIEERFPGAPGAACAYACRCHLPLVQVPPHAVWGRSKQVVLSPLDAWVGERLPRRSAALVDAAVLRYFRAFGPATVADAAAWCRLTGMREVVDRLRPQLRPFHDEDGRELLDVPDGPRPDPDVAAPVRFLPEYDNVVLSHADRRRFGDLAGAFQTDTAKGSVLVDGEGRAVWHLEEDPKADRVVLVVDHLPLTSAQRRAVEREGQAMVRFWREARAHHDVRLQPLT